MTNPSAHSTVVSPQDFSGCATFSWNRNTDQLEGNGTLADILGISAPPQTRNAFAACFDAADRDNVERLLGAGGGVSHPQEMELEISRAGSFAKRLNIRTHYTEGDQGDISLLHGLIIDVTRSRGREEDNRTDRHGPDFQIGHYHYDIGERLSWWSGSVYRLFGLPPQPIANPSVELREYIHPDDREIAVKLVEDASKTLGPYECSYRLVRKDGSILRILDRGETEGPIDPETGLARAARGVMIDVTGRESTEHSADLAEKAFEGLIDGAQFGVYLVDADFRIARISEGGQVAFANLGNVIGRDLGEVLHVMWPHTFAAEATAQFRNTLATGKPYRSNINLEERKDVGSIESYDWGVQRIMMPDGRFGCMCYFYNLTEMESAVDTLQDDADVLQMTIDNALAFIGVLDLTGRLTEVNKPALEAGGLRRSDVVGRKFWQAPWWNYSDKSIRKLKRSIAQARRGSVVRYDTDVRMRGNTIMSIDFMLSPIRASSGEVVSIVASGFDITERKKSENNVRLLMSEINHRSKNVLTLVQSIARLTQRSSPQGFMPAFEARLQALAWSYDLLIENPDRGASFAELARAQLAHVSDLSDGRVSLVGPDIEVTSEAAQGLSMAFHELATNAAKYGALSGDKGRVEIAWCVRTPQSDADKNLEVLWQEIGGPPVAPPERTGFGSTVLGPMAQSTLNAEVELNYDVTGVSWHARCASTCLAG